MSKIISSRNIDDLITRRDANRDGDCLDAGDATFYAVTDVQFSVVAMLTSTGKLHERVAYDSYGTARHHWKDDVDGDGDGDVDSSDKNAVTALLNKQIYQSGYNPAADIDRSGTIDSADASLVSSKVIAALPAGEISDRTAAGPDNTIGYDGYVFNPENLLYTVRFRHYDTGLGRWIERDPAGPIDGLNLFEYVKSATTHYSDPTGRCSVGPFDKFVDGVINIYCGAKRVGKGIYYGCGAVFDDEMAAEAADIWDFNAMVVTTLADLLADPERLKQALTDAIGTTLEDLGDLPPCVYEGILRDMGILSGVGAGHYAAGVLVKSQIMKAIKEHLAKKCRESILDHVKVRRPVRGAGGPAIVIFGYSCYGFVEQLHEASIELCIVKDTPVPRISWKTSQITWAGVSFAAQKSISV